MRAPITNQSLHSWLEYIEALHPSEIEMGLERIKSVYQKLPQIPNATSVITVAGTNGKGSTVRTIEALCQVKGISVGAYTSPHLIEYNERVQLDGTPVSDQQLVEAFELVEQARGSTQLTYFEFGTLAAFVVFALAPPAVVVLEIGLGGRLDAVNIVDPDVAVITSVAMDHESWLGNTREEIGAEKAGVIRRNASFVCGDLDPPLAVKTASNDVADQYYVGQGINFSPLPDGGLLKWQHKGQSQHAILDKRVTLMPQNVLCGVQALSCIGVAISQEVLDSTIPKLALNGRQQIVSHSPMVMLDVGHNPQAAKGLADRLGLLKGCEVKGRVFCLVGMLADKNHANTIAELLAVVDNWLVTGLNAGSRAMSAEELSETLLEAGALVVGNYSDPVKGYRSALKQMNSDDILVVFGSFYTVSAIATS